MKNLDYVIWKELLLRCCELRSIEVGRFWFLAQHLTVPFSRYIIKGGYGNE